jgi:hypothetical protein
MESQKFDGLDQRKYFRVKYPPTERPILRIGTHSFEVLDISERGLKFVSDQEIKFAEWVRGTLIFSDRASLVVEGRIIWKRETQIGLKLATPISYPRILKEQRSLVEIT